MHMWCIGSTSRAQQPTHLCQSLGPDAKVSALKQQVGHHKDRTGSWVSKNMYVAYIANTGADTLEKNWNESTRPLQHNACLQNPPQPKLLTVQAV